MEIKTSPGERSILSSYGKFGIVFIGIAVILLIGYFSALKDVSLDVDGKHYQWKTSTANVTELLHEKKVILQPGDVTNPSLTTRVNPGMKVNVIRAFPVKLDVGGEIKQINTIARPVSEILSQLVVTYTTEDKITPGLNTVIGPNQTIRVIRVSTKIITHQVAVNPATEYRKDIRLEQGTRKIAQQGKSGLMERQIKVVYENGRQSQAYTINEKIIKPALNTIIVMGIKPFVRTLQTSRGSYRYIELKTMNASAYYPGPESCGIYAVNGRTYLGRKAGFGIVAVDPRVIPLGTRLYIEGYGLAEAADKGAAIKGNRIDLCFETYREAEMFGRRMVKVYILE